MLFLPNAFFSRRKYFGLAISGTAIRGLSVGNNGSLVSYAQVPLAERVFEGDVVNQAALVVAFKQLLAQGKFGTAYTSVTFPERYAYSREYKLPTLPLDEVGEAIHWQIEHIFPFSPEEIYTDWKLLRQDEKGTEILVVAVQKTILDGLRAAMEQAGLYPLSFEPSAGVLSRMLSFEKQPVIGLVEVDSRGSTVTLVDKGVSLLTTSSPLASHKGDLVASVMEAVNSLTKYYVEKRKVRADSLFLYLTGERADQNLVTTLIGRYRLKAGILPIASVTPPFHLAYAASLTRVLAPRSEQSINLIPTALLNVYEATHSRNISRATFNMSFAVGVISLFIMVSVVGWLVWVQSSTAAELQQLQQQTANSEFPVGEIVSKAERIRVLFPYKLMPQQEFIELLSLVPATIRVESIDYLADKQLFKVVGVAQNRQELLRFREAFDSSEWFDEVHLPLGVFETLENINFSIEFKVKKPAV